MCVYVFALVFQNVRALVCVCVCLFLILCVWLHLCVSVCESAHEKVRFSLTEWLLQSVCGSVHAVCVSVSTCILHASSLMGCV